MSEFQEFDYDNSLEGDISVPVESPAVDDDELSTLDEPVRVTFGLQYANTGSPPTDDVRVTASCW